jgi:hypothetical protein
MTKKEEEIVKKLEADAKRLREKLDEQGGRGVELADQIDRLETAAEALRGRLHCPHCDKQLTGN